MQPLAINLKLNGRKVLCAGGSTRLRAKAELCHGAGAGLAWLGQAPEPRPERSFEVIPAESLEIQAAWIILALVDTGSAAEDQRWTARLRRLGIPVWLGSDSQDSDVLFPSTVNRGSLRVTADTGGRYPTISRWLRQHIEQILPQGLTRILDALDRPGAPVPGHLASAHQRRTFWYRLLDGSLPHRAAQLSDGALAQSLAQIYDEADSAPCGEVFLIGAGPGDPDLLTLKALRLIGQADIVLYDRLVSREVMALVRGDAEKVHVGKARANHSVPQKTINQLLVDYARQGKTVVRLKGGDPFIFGRGGEEIETLADAGVPFQVVPGITAASGCAAYAGIPLTHRDYAQSVRFVTGHLKNDSCDLPWRDLVQHNQTLVFYMGLVGLPLITRELMAHGMAADMPVALVSRGTTPEQVVVTGTLETIVSRVDESGVRAPTLVIVGEVVRLREKLDWTQAGQRDKAPEPS